MCEWTLTIWDRSCTLFVVRFCGNTGTPTDPILTHGGLVQIRFRSFGGVTARGFLAYVIPGTYLPDLSGSLYISMVIHWQQTSQAVSRPLMSQHPTTKKFIFPFGKVC